MFPFEIGSNAFAKTATGIRISETKFVSGHGLADQALHLMAMSTRFGQFSFERECRRNGSVADPLRKNLFIAGMARAGSTALLNTMYASGQFAATTYALMPFVLAPSLAKQLSILSSGNGTPVERAQRDGMLIGTDSPEALDGIFWSVCFPAR